MDEFRPIWQKKLEEKDVKYTPLGGWSDKPGWVMNVNEYESMEELSKMWSDEEIQKGLLKLRNQCKSFKLRIMRPTVSVR
jgi:hypothetical protein